MRVAVSGGFRPIPVPQSRSWPAFPHPRSSIRTCGFPASGWRARSCLRPREASGLRHQAGEAVGIPQLLVRKAHMLPGPDLVLVTEPGTANPPSHSPIPSLPCGANSGWMDDSYTPRQTGSGTKPGRPVLSIMPGAWQQPDIEGSRRLWKGFGAWLKRYATRRKREKSR